MSSSHRPERQWRTVAVDQTHADIIDRPADGDRRARSHCVTSAQMNVPPSALATTRFTKTTSQV
jgi:hypothetical protein